MRSDEGEDRRLLRISVAVAVLLHGVLALMPLPAASERSPEPEVLQRPIAIHPTPRFRPPEKITQAHTAQLPVRVPVPVPQMESPHVARDHRVDDHELWDFGGMITGVELPPPPPPPEPEGPVRLSHSAPELRRVHHVQPAYPAFAQQIGVGGSVILDVLVGRDGMVKEISVLRAEPFGFTESALAAVRQWRYVPPVVGGRSVEVQVAVTVRFELR